MHRHWLLAALALGSGLVVALGSLFPTLPLAAQLPAAISILAVLPILSLLRRRDRAGIAALLAGATLALLITAATWTRSHPVVHVDNATDHPIQLWIDGEAVMVVPPSSGAGEPPHVRVAYGERRLAWSALGSIELAGEIRAEVVAGMDHLYNPGKIGCYWLEATAYGDASTHGAPHGPLPVKEFHRFESVAVWFGDNPRRVDSVGAGRSAVRVAIQRNRRCMELSRLGCSSALRSAFVRCERTVAPLSEPADCFDEAKKACKE